MARAPQGGPSSQRTQSTQQGTASENLWNQIRGGQVSSNDNQQQQPPAQSRAPPSGGNGPQRSQNSAGSPSPIRSPFASFGFGGQQDTKRPGSSDSDDESDPMPSSFMQSGPPQPQGFNMPSMQSSRGRPSSSRPTDADNPQSVNTPSRSDQQQSGGFADGSPIQDQINRMRSRFPSSSDDDGSQPKNRQASRQQGPSLEETVNRWVDLMVPTQAEANSNSLNSQDLDLYVSLGTTTTNSSRRLPVTTMCKDFMLVYNSFLPFWPVC